MISKNQQNLFNLRKFYYFNNFSPIKITISAFYLLFCGITPKLNAAIMFTNDVKPQEEIFSASFNDDILGISRAENTEDGFRIFTLPGENPNQEEPAIGYLDLDNNGEGSLILSTVTRNFDVDPASKVTFNLSVSGEFEVLGNETVTITPDITLLNNIGGDPVITYDANDQNFINEQSGTFKFSESATTESKISQGGLELFGSFNLSGIPGDRVIFRFPNSINASVSTPESSLNIGLFVFGTLIISSIYRKKLK